MLGRIPDKREEEVLDVPHNCERNGCVDEPDVGVIFSRPTEVVFYCEGCARKKKREMDNVEGINRLDS